MTNLENLLNIKYNDILDCKVISARNLHTILGTNVDFTRWWAFHFMSLKFQDYVSVGSRRYSIRGELREDNRDFLITLNAAYIICSEIYLNPYITLELKQMSKAVSRIIDEIRAIEFFETDEEAYLHLLEAAFCGGNEEEIAYYSEKVGNDEECLKLLERVRSYL